MNSEDLRRRIGEVLILLFYAVVDVSEIWPRSHFWAILSLWFVLIVFTSVELWNLFGIALGVVFTLAGLIVVLLFPTPPTPAPEPWRGWLQAGNAPTPANPCGVDVPANEILGLIGDNAAFVRQKSQIAPVGIFQCRPVLLEKTPNGIKIQAAVYDMGGKYLGRIHNSGYDIEKTEGLVVEHSGDLTRLIVHNGTGDELLYIDYVNPQVVRIRGVFACPPHRTIVTVTDRGINPGSGIRRSCLGEPMGTVAIQLQ